MTEQKCGKIISFLNSFGLFILFLFSTLLIAGILVYLLGNIWGLNNYLTAGVPYLLIGYFWGVFFLQKQKLKKIVGIIMFTLTVLINLLLVSSPYNNKTEFISTRVFIITALGSGIFLIFRQSIVSRIFGILLLIISIFAALLGAVFMSAKL